MPQRVLHITDPSRTVVREVCIILLLRLVNTEEKSQPVFSLFSFNYHYDKERKENPS